ncbi:hypothetical protein XAP412_530003 [Xanthomonas phaseoli pv. phaseoli]|uniref:Uncharacterized protein n=1 Tax=Xanthomonas campestris pv. phaseoli TaxID=317013 RepID=A0AB38E2I8_XANCH|nr:hypothetical protein XAP6984_580003 [Xanthomonas phaseoli pv. phaseoli]SON87384.1 hypothetical protein XAP412_530003 [Xanthomonas phaseoli pv. phaseoli]SON91193.1 hypothetical protein XAP7430_540003 [Xanthomonas phaseoli pv. phaseoli]
MHWKPGPPTGLLSFGRPVGGVGTQVTTRVALHREARHRCTCATRVGRARVGPPTTWRLIRQGRACATCHAAKQKRPVLPGVVLCIFATDAEVLPDLARRTKPSGQSSGGVAGARNQTESLVREDSAHWPRTAWQ